MNNAVTLLLGPAASGKRDRLFALYERHLANPAHGDRTGGVLWLAPSPVAADALRRRVLESRPAVLGPGIKLIGQAADAILAAAPVAMRPLTATQKSHLLVDLIQDPAAAQRFRMLRRAVATPGGVDFVARFISRAIRSGQPAERILAHARSSHDPRAVELASAYEAYVQETTTNRMLDADARLRMACELLEQGQGGPLARLALLVVEGVSAPTPLEQRFVEALIAASEHAAIAITIDASTPPADGEPLWRGPAAFVERLKRRFPHAECEHATTDAGEWPMRDHALERLFRDPRGATPAGVPPGNPPMADLTIRPAQSAQDDVQQTARRVKRLLCDGVPPEEIVVAARSAGDLATRLVEAFAEVGAPLALQSAPLLGHAPVARSLAAVLRLAASDWRHDDLIAVVTSPRFELFNRTESSAALEQSNRTLCRRFGFASPRAAVEWTLREMLMPKGRRAVMDRLGWLADRWRRKVEESEKEQDDLAPDPGAPGLRVLAAAAIALPAMTRLAELTQELDAKATSLEWRHRCVDVLKALGYQSPPHVAGAPSPLDADRAALAALEEAWASLERLQVWRGAAPPSLGLEGAERRVRDWLGSVRLELPREHEGRVRALGADAARTLRPAHLIVVGLDEGSFPRFDGAAPLPGESREERDERERGAEMLLFYELLASARRSVTLSYPALDSKGQPLNPSPYVAELERLFEPRALRRDADTNGESAYGGLSITQVRRAAVRELCAGDGSAQFERLLATPPLAPLADTIAKGLRASHARSHGDGFGPWEGVLASEGARARLRQDFGPEHLWSAHQLELYATCPFKFFMESVLRVAPLETLGLDVNYLRRGTLLHEAMVRFHRAVNGMLADDQPTTSIDPERFAEAFRTAVHDSLQALASAPHEAALAEIEALQAEAWGRGYCEQHEAYDRESQSLGAQLLDSPLRAAHYEARFGPARSYDADDDEPLSTDEPFAFAAGDERVLLTGRIDRIDVARVGGRTVFNVVDYKTGRSFRIKQEDIESGRMLQLVLYTLAVEEHLFAGQDAAPWRAGYWAVQNKGYITKGIPQPEEEEGWNDLVAKVKSRVAEIVSDIRGAQFPMFNDDENCGRQCDFRTVCRVAQARSLGKQSERAALGSPRE